MEKALLLDARQPAGKIKINTGGLRNLADVRALYSINKVNDFCLKLRTMSDIQHLIVPLEHAIHEFLLPALTVVSYPDPDSQQLRMDYITATWKVGLAHRSNFFVLGILDFGEPIKLQPVVTSRCYLITSVIAFHS